MTLRLPIILLLFSTGMAHAEPGDVRSGEHADFSRLVVEVGPSAGWQLGRVQGGYEFRSGVPGLNFRLDDIFRFIPRDRIAKVDAKGSGVFVVTLACECHADAFEIREGRIVVDIKDGKPPASAKFEAELTLNQPPHGLTSEEPAHQAQAVATPKDKGAEQNKVDVVQNGAQLPLVLKNSQPNALLPFVSSGEQVEKPNAKDKNSPPASPETQSPDRKEQLANMEAALLAQLSRAAGQGLIEPDVASDPRSAGQQDPKESPAAPESDGEIEASAKPAEPDVLDHLRIQSSVDRDAPASSKVAAHNSEGNLCSPDTLFDVESWGPSDGLLTDYARHRSGLTTEFDILDTDAGLALVQHYLFLTFGAEARSVLGLFDPPLPNADIYQALAAIMDDPAQGASGRLEREITCTGRVALWALLASPNATKSKDIDGKSIKAAFSALPSHLRARLGPTLANRFAALGDKKSALTVRNMISRGPGNHGQPFELLDALLDNEVVGIEQTSETLTDLVHKDVEISPDALLNLIQMRMSEGVPVDQSTMDAAFTYAFEFQGSGLGPDLTVAAVQALIKSGQAHTAIDQLMVAGKDNFLEPEITAVLWSTAFEALAEIDSNFDFLRYALNPDYQENIALVEPSTKLRLAERLIELGFLDEAKHLLITQDPIDEPWQLLLSRLAIEQGNPNAAISHLEGLNSEHAKILRAKAMMADGRFHSASNAFQEIQKQELQATAAWQGGAWDTVQQIGSPEQKAAASLALGEDPLPAEESELGPIGQAERLVASSKETRSILASLLESLDGATN